MQFMLNIGDHRTLTTYITATYQDFLTTEDTKGSEGCSTKMEGHFMVSLTTRTAEDRQVAIKVQKTHYGRALEVGRIPLTKETV